MEQLGRLDPVKVKEEFEKLQKKLDVARDALAKIKHQKPVIPERVVAIASEALDEILNRKAR